MSLPPPEARLQLALDFPSLRACRAVVAALTPRLARVEVGTPLLLHEGLRAVEWLRGELGPARRSSPTPRSATPAPASPVMRSRPGADVVTVVGAAADMTTWKGVLQAAAASPGRPAVVIDTVGWEPGAAAGRSDAALRCCRAGWGDGGRVRPPPEERAAAVRRTARAAVGGGRAPVSRLSRRLRGDRRGLIGPALAAGFGTVIVGAAVTEASHPAARLVGPPRGGRRRPGRRRRQGRRRRPLMPGSPLLPAGAVSAASFLLSATIQRNLRRDIASWLFFPGADHRDLHGAPSPRGRPGGGHPVVPI